MKHIKFFALAIMLSLFATASQSSSEELVEVMLASKLDEPRGYCLDIAGGKGANARLERGLQAHTCYHYTGNILEDQGFDVLIINEGIFRIPYFDVCMTASSFVKGSCNPPIKKE